MYSSTTDLQIINKNLGFDLIEDSTLEDTKLNLETNKYHIGYSSHEILLLKLELPESISILLPG